MQRVPSKALWAGVLVLAFIGIAAGVLRLTILAKGPGAGPNPALNAGFAAHPVVTVIHILPGMLFMLVAPLQFVACIRARAPHVHRWIGRSVLAVGLVIGITAFVMSFRMAIGGIHETAATVLFDSLFLFCLAKGYAAARRRDFGNHREWMIRMFGIGLGIGTTRPVMGVFFATARLTHLTLHDFFGTAFWIGFTTAAIAAEGWILYTRGCHVTFNPARPVEQPG